MPSTAFTSAAPVEAHGVDWRRYALVALGTIGAAVLANALVYFVAGTIVAYDPRFLPLATVGGPVIFTAVPAVVAVLLYALLLRFSRNPERVFTSIAAVVLVLSVIPDFLYIPTVPGSSLAQTAVLVSMHLVAAVVIVSMLTGLARRGAR